MQKKKKNLNKVSKFFLKNFLVPICLVGIFFVGYFSEKVNAATVEATIRISVCGNNMAEYGEDCDNLDFKGNTCETLDYDYGVLLCQVDCSFDKTNCFEDEEEDDDNDSKKKKKKSKKKKSQNIIIDSIRKDGETRTLEIENNQDGHLGSASFLENRKIKIITRNQDDQEIEIVIFAFKDMFIIKQGNVYAINYFSVIIQEEAKKVFIVGPKGKSELKVFPKEIFKEVNQEKEFQIKKIEIGANKNDDLIYIIELNKQEKFLGLFKIKIPFKMEYSLEKIYFIGKRTNFFWRIVDFLSF